MVAASIASLFFNRALTQANKLKGRGLSTLNQHTIGMLESQVPIATFFHVLSDMREGEEYNAYIQRSMTDILQALPSEMHSKPLILASSSATVADADAYEKAKKMGDSNRMEQLLVEPRYVGHTVGAVGVITSDGSEMSVIEGTGVSFVPDSILEKDDAILPWFCLNRTEFNRLEERRSFQTLSFIDIHATNATIEQIQTNIQTLRTKVSQGSIKYDRMVYACGQAMFYALTGAELGKKRSTQISHGESILRLLSHQPDEVRWALTKAIEAVGLFTTADQVAKERVIDASSHRPRTKP